MTATFSVHQKELLSLLASMQPICNKRTTLDVTETVLFNVTTRELTIKATDLEISLQATMVIDGTIDSPLSFLISGKRIFELVKEMEGSISFSLEEGQLKLTSKGIDLSLNTRDAADFPPFPERIENLMGIEGNDLLKLLNKVAFIIPQNNANNALNGMLLEINKAKMSMVATDGYSLAQVETSSYTLPEEHSWLIPKRAVMEIRKLTESNPTATIFLGACGNQLVFSGEHFNLFTKLIADSFPHYASVLNKDGFEPGKLAREPFVKTLKRTGCLLSGQFVGAKFNFSPGTMTVHLHNKEVGKLEEKIQLSEYAAQPFDTYFYSPYLLNGLLALHEDTVSFFVKNSSTPIIFESSSGQYSFTYLVMPVATMKAD